MIPLAHEILMARERDAWEWEQELARERPGSLGWAKTNALLRLRRAWDKRDLPAVRIWAFLLRQLQEAERRAVFGGDRTECLMKW